MLYRYPQLASDERRVLDKVAEMRTELRHHVVLEPRRWSGLLARITRARALRASNSIEDIHVTAEDALAVIDNEAVEDADRATWNSVRGYHEAMNYILQRCRDPNFQFSLDMILACHFMICQHDLNSNPGQLRPGWVGVHNTRTGEVVHEGVERGRLEALLNHLVNFMNSDGVGSLELKAAMTHVNLTLLHPFSDGNGRMARCLQTAVLAKDGIIAPVFSSIEEYIGHNQQAYYDVLAQAGGGGWNPDRDCSAWVRFCIAGHYRQLQTIIRRMTEFSRRYVEFAEIVRKQGLPERTALALLQASTGSRVRNSSYRVSADVSNNLASRDLKALVDAGLLLPEGERRGRNYKASDVVRQVREKCRMLKAIDDPFDDPAIVG